MYPHANSLDPAWEAVQKDGTVETLSSGCYILLNTYICTAKISH
jgi:hypothetical protein